MQEPFEGGGGLAFAPQELLASVNVTAELVFTFGGN